MLVLVATREPIARTQVDSLTSFDALVAEVAPDGAVTSWLSEQRPRLAAHLLAGGTVVVRAQEGDPTSKESDDHARLVVSAGQALTVAVPVAGFVATGGENGALLCLTPSANEPDGS